MVVSTREAGGASVRHKNADKVRRSRGVLPPFSQPQFLFCFIPPLLGCFCIRVSVLVIFSGRIRLLKLPACVLERQTHRSIRHFGRRDENWWRREQEQECSVGRLEERRRGWSKVKLLCLRCTTNDNVFLYFMYFAFLCGIGVDMPLSPPCDTWPRMLSCVSREWSR